MANKRTLKRDINYVFGDIIEAALLHQMLNPEEDASKSSEIVNEAMSDYDDLIAKMNRKDVENKKQHFKSISRDLEVRANQLVEKINTL